MLCLRRRCCINGAVCRNARGQCGQARGLRPVCVMLCLRNAERSPKALGQDSHLNGFSPVWTRMWTFKSVEPRNARLQTRQKRGLLVPKVKGKLTKNLVYGISIALENEARIQQCWPTLWLVNPTQDMTVEHDVLLAYLISFQTLICCQLVPNYLQKLPGKRFWALQNWKFSLRNTPAHP